MHVKENEKRKEILSLFMFSNKQHKHITRTDHKLLFKCLHAITISDY